MIDAQVLGIVLLVCSLLGANEAWTIVGPGAGASAPPLVHPAVARPAFAYLAIPAGFPASSSSSSFSSSSSSIGPDGRPVTITKTHTTGDATAFATGSAVDPNDPGNYAGSASLSASAPGRDPVLKTQRLMSGSGIALATADAGKP